MVLVLLTRVKEPNDTDCQNLVGMINFLNGKNKQYLNMIANDLKVIKWYVDAIFALHPDLNIHTGDIMTMGQRDMQSASSKHKLNTGKRT